MDHTCEYSLCTASGWRMLVIGQYSYENCAVQWYYAENSGKYLSKFRDYLSGPILGIKNGCPETLRNNPEEHNSHLLRAGSLK